MARTNYLRPLVALAVFGVLPIVAACGGKVVSLGSTGSNTMAQVDPKVVGGSAGACPTGYAHPNICCSGANGTPACGAWEESPFRACDPGWSTYPNPLSCCSLGNAKDCIDTPKDAGVPKPPPPFGCGFVCPPGWYEPGDAPKSPGSGSCCHVTANGATECEGWATAVPVTAPNCGISVAPSPPPYPPPPAYDAGPAPDAGGPSDAGKPHDAGPPVDAGEPDASVDAGTCDDDAGYGNYDGGPWSLCGECPAGWTPDSFDPSLCCQLDPSGVRECFSQATGPVGSVGTVDAGVPPTPVGPPTTTGACGGATDGSSCSCSSSVSSTQYQVDCSTDSSGASTCFCQQDGKTVSQFASKDICSQVSALQSLLSSSTGCNFPIK